MKYRGYTITHNPKPIPLRAFDYDYVHDEYDGPDDDRCGSEPSVKECKVAIDTYAAFTAFVAALGSVK